MPLQATSGAASYDAFGGGAAAVPNYIEDVFSTYLYTGNDTTQTITNGIDLSGKGGLVWVKNRISAFGHSLTDTARGTGKVLQTNNTNASQNWDDVTAFSSSGFTVSAADTGNTNSLDNTYASWTFRKQPKFFDVVTYTGNDVGGRTVSHNLGSAPGCMIIKRTDVNGYFWVVYHRGANGGVDPEQYYFQLNATNAQAGPNSSVWNNTAPTSTNFTLGTASAVNLSGATYIAYLFAHNAGGFGLTGTDNVISCGSYTGNGSGSGPTVTLGYEPQWLLIKRTDSTSNWTLIDNMRGIPTGSDAARLFPNLSNAEITNQETANLLATGFKIATADAPVNASGGTYIYIAIRRGPMKTPTDATKVFAPVTYTGDGSTSTGQLITTGFPVDMGINRYNRSGAGDWDFVDRLRGITGVTYTTSPQSPYLNPHNTNAEALGGYIFAATNTTVKNYGFSSSFVQANYLFQRAPSFFDEVCYTGDGTAARNITHNLTVAPEMIIVKARSAVNIWPVWATSIAYGSNVYLNLTNAIASGNTDVLNYNETTNTPVPPTSTTFTVGTQTRVNGSGTTYVAYLFATCAGVSKVGSYTGDASADVVVNCGFTAGARFVLIKRTDSTGDWYVYDSARGITASNDPYLLLNSTAAEVTGTNYIGPYSTGFYVPTGTPLNAATGATYIFLAIA